MNQDDSVIIAASLFIVALSTLLIKLQFEKKKVEAIALEEPLPVEKVHPKDVSFEEVEAVLENLQNPESTGIDGWLYAFEHVSFPITFLFAVHVIIDSICPGYFVDNRAYAIPALSSLFFVNSKIQGVLKDRIWVDNLGKMYAETFKQSYTLGCLEKMVVEAMADGSREGRYKQYKWIKYYAVKFKISEKALLNVYMHCCNLNKFHGIERVGNLTEKEGRLCSSIKKMLNYKVSFENKKLKK